MARAEGENPRVQAIMDAAYNRMSEQADIWYENGDFPRVAHLLRYKSALFPHDYEANTDLGWILESIDQHGEALATYIAFKRNNPGLVDACLPEAQFYYIRRVYAKIPPLLEPAIRLKPHPNAFRMLARSYEQLNLLADSRRVWQRYLDKTPGDQQARRNLERVERKMRGAQPEARLR